MPPRGSGLRGGPRSRCTRPWCAAPLPCPPCRRRHRQRLRSSRSPPSSRRRTCRRRSTRSPRPLSTRGFCWPPRGNLANVNVLPADFVPVRLQLDRPLGDDRRLLVLVEIVFKDRVVDNLLVVEQHRRAGADLDDVELVPLADWFIGQRRGVFAGGAGAVVPQAAGALVRTEVPITGGFVGVPDLDLRGPLEIDAAVPLGDQLPFDDQLKVAVVLGGGHVGPLAVVDELAVLDLPVGEHVGGVFLAFLREFVGRKRLHLPRVLGSQAIPAREILAVVNGGETFRGDVVGGDTDGRERKQCRRHGGQPAGNPANQGATPGGDL